ncbi:cobalt-precorrin-5B (C1)-methyltransferase [Thiohalospira halophila DSM 15071]|uniref:Cobalt-precorrin-5B C(1)-methyltransferase n=1 Tax=Thiohalospira halophila DSM 15071 TaxID=1123397 RepID=A0A1I1Q4T7_9GAMM|nr:cobalt-precorrin-5B (C(1))-methyltransferase [Thiohalospira halophila]SFD17141.1 cobalt-precorrin-5B (C1)-methyltransferase [Thiohalospira halophila DSM 15071]
MTVEGEPHAAGPGPKVETATLRTGLTTGVCATAAAVAAARLALGQRAPDPVPVTLPRGEAVTLPLHDSRALEGAGEAGTIKDAGDDPDATHGARVWARVRATPDAGIAFLAGAGVGTVTRPGLPVPAGEPAINPVPRRMLTEHLERVAAEAGHPGGFEVTVGVDDGERIAERTMNPRLGIRGGISILGTTGIVRPFSCSAYIASIHQAIEVARSNGLQRVAACTGGTSEDFARRQYGLEDLALIEMGDAFGAVLKYLRRRPLPALLLVAGFGKLSKFAAGHLDTHSRKSAIDLDFLARQAAEASADAALCERITASNTSIEALDACREAGVPLGNRIATLARDRAGAYLPAGTGIEVCAVDRNGEQVGLAPEVGV